MAPAQRQRLVDAQARERQDGQQRPPVRPGPRLQLAVESPGGVEERGDVVGAVEIRPGGLDGRQPAALALRDVARRVPVLDGELEDRRERRQALVHRGRADAPLAHLRPAEAVDVLDRDRVEAPARERGQQVDLELPAKVGLPGGAQARAAPAALRPLGLEPLRREDVEGRDLARRLDVRGRLPLAAADLLKDVGELPLGVLAGDAIGGVPDVLELAATQRAEANTEAHAPRRLLLDDAARRLPSHEAPLDRGAGGRPRLRAHTAQAR